MKKCSKCKKIKSLSSFYREKRVKSGLCGSCKDCKRTLVKLWKIANPELSKSYGSLEYYRKYRKRKPEVARKSVKKWSLKNPHKLRAHRAVRSALELKKLQRMPCERCGSQKTDAHHEDYTKVLSVRWLCRKHHKEIH